MFNIETAYNIIFSRSLCGTVSGALSSTSATGERRRFGDPPSDNTRKNRKRTPRLRHPMEIQAVVRYNHYVLL